MTELIALVKSHSCHSQTISCAVNKNNYGLTVELLKFYLLHVNSIRSEYLLYSLIVDRLCCESFRLKIAAILFAK